MEVKMKFSQTEMRLIEFLQGRLFTKSPEELIRYLVRRAGISVKFQELEKTREVQNDQPR